MKKDYNAPLKFHAKKCLTLSICKSLTGVCDFAVYNMMIAAENFRILHFRNVKKLLHQNK